FANVDIGEMMVFQTALSAEDRATVERYLIAKWGLSIDSDGDGVPNTIDTYPDDASRVVDIPALLTTPGTPSLWLSGRADVNGDQIPEAGVGVGVSDRTGLSKWVDWSGNRNHATQSNPTLRPQLGANGVGFDGVDDAMTLPVSLLNNQAFTVFIVEKKDADTEGYVLGGMAVATRSLSIGYRDASGVVYDKGNGTSAQRLYHSSSEWSGSLIRVLELSLSSANGMVLAINGAPMVTGNTALQMQLLANEGLTLGASGTVYYKGTLMEVLVYPSELSADNRLSVQRYLGAKWGVSLDADGDRVSNELDQAPTNNQVANYYLFNPILSSPVLASAMQNNLKLWVLATTNGITKGTTGRVARWIDFSGNRNHGVQPDPLYQPLLINNNRGTWINFANAINEFNHYFDYDGSFFINRPYTVYVIESRNSWNGIFLSGRISSARVALYYDGAGRVGVSHTSSTGNTNVVDYLSELLASNMNQITRMHTVVFSTQNGLAYHLSGIKMASSTYNIPLARFEGATIGGTYYGDIGEILMFNRDLSLDERLQIDNYLANKWGLSVDTDGDKVINVLDMYPTDNTRWSSDMDSDGVPDSQDDYPNDNTKVVNIAQLSPSLNQLTSAAWSTLKLWVDSSTINALQQDSAGRIARLYDRSGNRNHMATSNVEAMPNINTGTINSVKAAYFDQSAWLDAPPMTFYGNELTIMMVASRETALGAVLLAGIPSGNQNINYFFPVADDNTLNLIYTGRGSPMTSLTKTNHPGNAVPYYVTTWFGGGMNEMYYNGALQSRNGINTPWSAGNLNVVGWRLGADSFLYYPYKGYIGEVLVFHSSLSLQDRYWVDEYMGNKWKIAVDTDGDGVINQSDAYPTDNTRTVAPIADWTQMNLSVSPNLMMWTRTSTSNTEYVLNAGKVTTWIDLSNRRNAFFATPNASYAPTLRVSSDNRLPMVSFDGLSQFLQTNWVASRSYTVYMIMKTSVTGNGSLVNQAVSDTPILTGKVSGVANDLIPFSITGGVLRTYTGNPDATLSSGVVVNGNTNRLVAVSREVTSGTRMLYVDGARAAMDTAGLAGVTLNATTQLTLGADLVNGRYWKGDVGEVMIFNTVIPTQDRYLLDQYFAKRWGVVVDTDGDGVANDVDLYPTSNRNSALDLDGDGVPNAKDAFPLDPSRVVNASLYGSMATLMPSVQLWLVATAQAVSTSSMGVVTWFDWSGLGRHASGINAPLWAGTGIQFNGASQYMTVPYSVSLNRVPLTIVAVIEPVKVKDASVISTLGDGVGYSIGFNDTKVTLIRRGAMGVTMSTPLAARPARKLLVVMAISTPSTSLTDGYGNPVVVAQGGDEATQNAWLLGIQQAAGSGSGFYQGNILEVMVFNRLLSQSELIQLSDDSQARWGVALDRDGDGWPDHLDAVPTHNLRLVPLDTIMPSFNLLSSTAKNRLRGWWGVSGNSVLLGSGDTIGAWANWATMTQSAWQPTPNAQPALAPFGNTNRLGVGFDGQDWMAISGAMVRNTPYTLMIIEQPQLNRTGNYIIGNASGEGFAIGYHQDKTQLMWSHGTNREMTWQHEAYSPDTPRIHTFQFDPSVGRLAYLNGALMATDNLQMALAEADTLQIGMASLNGTTRFYNGVVAEIIGFDGALSLYDRYVMDQYLGAKYGISMDTDGDGVPNGGDDYPMDPTLWGDRQAVAPALSGVSAAAMQQLSLWLNTAYTPSVVIESGGVLRVADLSGQQHHATQYTVGYRPKWVDTGTEKAAVYRPTSPTFLTVASGSRMVSTTQSVIMVVKWDGVKYVGGGMPGSQGVLWYRSTPQGEWVMALDRPSVGESVFRLAVPTDTGLKQLTYPVVTGNVSTVVGMLINPQQLSLLVDGTSRGQLNNPGTLVASMEKTLLGRGVGLDSGWGGQIQEVMVFNTSLSTADRLVIDQYLGKKWGISMDTDGDGDPNPTDPDPVNPSINTNDRDGDGVPNSVDTFPDDPTKVVDFNAMTESAGTGSGASLKGLSDPLKRGLKGWYVATSSALMVDGFGKIRTWFDWSGNQSHLMQSNSGLQPMYWGAAFGGRGAVQFDGLNDGLEWRGVPLLSQSFSVVVVEERLASGAQYLLGGQAPLSTDLSGVVLGYQSDTQAVAGLFGTGRYAVVASGGLATSPQTIHSLVFTKGSGMRYYRNASESPVATTSLGDAITSYPNALVGGMSNGNYFNGNIVEMMVFTTPLETGDREIIESYMAAKWGVRLDTDGDGAPNDYDEYPYQAAKVVKVPDAIEAVSANCQLWLSASGDHNGNGKLDPNESGRNGMLITPTGSVEKWIDWSGHQQHARPFDANPALGVNPVGIHGMPSMAFRPPTFNVMGFGSAPNGLSLPVAVSNNDVTLFLVHRPSRVASSTLVGSQSKKLSIELTPNGQLALYQNGATVASSGITTATGNASIVVTEWALTGVTLYLNGVEAGRVTSTQTPQVVTLSIGIDPDVSLPYEGDIAEVLVVNTIMNPLARQAIERYLGVKWGIAIDQDGDGVLDPYDAYPQDASQVVSLPSALQPLKNALSIWLSGSGDVTGNGVLTDADDITVSPIEWDDQNRVMHWYDWSGNRRHMRPPFPHRRPTAALLNGVMAVGFDGQSLLRMVGDGMVKKPSTVILVMHPRVSANMTVMADPSGLAISVMAGATLNDGSVVNWGYPAGNQVNSSQYLGRNTPLIMMGTLGEDGTLRLRINGSAEGSATLTQPVPNGPWVIGQAGVGDTGYFTGSVGEVIGFNRVLTDAEGASVGRYLATKWKVLNDADGDGVSDLLDEYPDDAMRAVSVNRVSATLNQVTGISQLALWLMADRGVTAKDSKVVTWVDWSGKQHHVYQNQGDRLPTLVENGLNGRPVVRFDGLTDHLLLPEGQSVSTPVYVWVVAKRQSGSNRQYPLSLGQSIGLGYETSSNIAIQDGATNLTGYQWDTWRSLAPSIITAVIDSTASSLRVNGLVVSKGSGLTRSLSNWKVGGFGTDYFNGDVAEVMVMSGEVSARDQLLIDQYLSSKWGIEMDSDSDGIPNALDDVPGDSTQMVTLAKWAPEWLGLSDGAKSSLAWWLSGDTKAWTVSNGGVTQWADWGRSQGVAIGEQAASQPGLQVGSTGKLMLALDGVNDYLQVRPRLLVGEAMTMIVVGQPTTAHEVDPQSIVGSTGSTGQRYVLYPTDLGDNQTSMGVSWGTNGITVYERSSNRWAPVLVSTEPVSGVSYATIEYNNRVPRLSINGKTVATQSNATLGTLAIANSLGGQAGASTGFYQGLLGEVMVFNQLLSTSDRYIMDGYLATKWGVIPDTDGDGVPNAQDAYPTDNTRVLDAGLYQQWMGQLSADGAQKMSLWLKAGPKFGSQDANNRLTKWFDISGNGRHATVSSGNGGPVLASANTQSVVRFDGTQALSLPVD
ncbi:hypothetical protein EBZ35_02070, partial [bacterium]|nr:hypothetical protein [bacterium]